MKTFILALALISTPLYAGGYSSNGQFVADSAWTSIAEGLRAVQRRDARESRRERKRNRRTRTSCSSKMQVNGMVSTDCTTR